jgi:hypothetical protein
MAIAFNFTPELHLLDGRIVRNLEDAIAFAREQEPRPGVDERDEALHRLERAETREQAHALRTKINYVHVDFGMSMGVFSSKPAFMERATIDRRHHALRALIKETDGECLLQLGKLPKPRAIDVRDVGMSGQVRKDEARPLWRRHGMSASSQLHPDRRTSPARLRAFLQFYVLE